MTASENIRMPDKKTINLPKKDNVSTKKNGAKKFVLVFSLLLGLVIYVIFMYKETWLGAINRIDIFGHNSNTKDAEDISVKQESISEKDGKEKTDISSYKEEGFLPRFAPDEQDLDILNDEADLNPYECEVKGGLDSNTQIVSDVNMINNLNDYRIYLANVHEFLYKFSKDQTYSENLDIITQIELPKEFEGMIEMLKSYNAMLLKGDALYEQIPLFDIAIFNKFLKIQKETNSYKEMKMLKAKIENKIDLFTSYAFSLDIQEQFFE